MEDVQEWTICGIVTARLRAARTDGRMPLQLQSQSDIEFGEDHAGDPLCAIACISNTNAAHVR